VGHLEKTRRKRVGGKGGKTALFGPMKETKKSSSRTSVFLNHGWPEKENSPHTRIRKKRKKIGLVKEGG